MANAVTHFQFGSPDPDRLARFYHTAFGWDATAYPETDYLALETHTGGIKGGIARVPDDGAPFFALYVEVDDLDPVLRQIAGSGGRQLTAVAAMAPLGVVAMFADPEGHPMGLVEATPDFGHHEYRVYDWPDPVGEGGVPHFEILGRDAAALQAFYRNVFGWHVDTLQSPEYAPVDTHTIGIGGAIGVLDRPSHPVTVYIQSADFDATLAAVEAAGGRTLASHAPVFALFADPDGNTVGLVSPQEDLEGME